MGSNGAGWPISVTLLRGHWSLEVCLTRSHHISFTCRICEFAEMFSKKLGVNSQLLNKTLWGDFYLNTKTKRIMKGAQAKGKKPLFVQFILENLWTVHETILEKR